MPEFDTVIRSTRVVVPEGTRAADVVVREGRIEAVLPYRSRSDESALPTDGGPTPPIVDLADRALLPGAVDLGTGVHVPGHDLGECYRSAAAEALRGGVTCLVVSPAPARPAITCADSLQVHQSAAAGVPVHVAFLGGVTPGTGPLDLADLQAGGAIAFQASLSDGGAPDMAALGDARLRKTMAELTALDSLLMVHAEDASELGTPAVSAGRRPPRAERRGLERVIAAARVVGTRTHVGPFTAAECAALLSAAGAAGVELGAHTCPHYLCLPEDLPGPGSPVHACRPPLRSDANRKALWSALLEEGSSIRTVGSGHLPAIGLRTLEWSLPALWTAARRRGLSLEDLARWTARSPADLLRLNRGRIAPGFEADLVAFDDGAVTPVPSTDPGPYAGMDLVGRVERVWVGGRSAQT
ncbi:amidohydrolase family protein [Nocardiopsis alba]|uniref:amidohydrolase family protein n=1 Tax=Nocardiopsis alba TaxID=53437 RepID=UPI003672BA77